MASNGIKKPFRIAIVGGGIGGLYCALAIHHQCVSTTIDLQIDVYEQASEYKEIGAGIGLGVNAAKLVHRLGLGKQLEAISALPERGWVSYRRFDNSDEVVLLPNMEQEGMKHASVSRAELLDLLKAAVEARGAARLHTKKAFEKVEDLGSSVRLHFVDKTTAEANLVIGADGIHSAVRAQFTNDSPIFSCIAYRAVIPMSALTSWPLDKFHNLWIAKNRHLLLFSMSHNEQLNVVAFVSKDEPDDVEESWTSLCDREDVEKDFAGFDDPVQQIIHLMPKKPSKWRINDREPLDRWHYMNGKVVLLGDSCHPMLPHLGAGAGQAIEDGWILAKALREFLSNSEKGQVASLEKAASLYQTIRLPRAQNTQAGARLMGDTYQIKTPEMVEKSFEECLPGFGDELMQRVRTLAEEDIDASFERALASNTLSIP